MRRSAIKACTAATRQIKSMLVTAPQAIHTRFESLDGDTLIATLATTCPGSATESVPAATGQALHRLARRHQYLTSEISDADQDMRTLLTAAAPALIAAPGLGLVTAATLAVTAGDNPDRLRSEASFAALCGAAPIHASSGKTTRYRLNRGGDRQANWALHQIALVRLSHDPRTRQYATTLQAHGKISRDVFRCLKRAIAREVYHLLVHPDPVQRTDDLRDLRHAHQLTLTDVATRLHTVPARISELERGLRPNRDLGARYRELLTATD